VDQPGQSALRHDRALFLVAEFEDRRHFGRGFRPHQKACLQGVRTHESGRTPPRFFSGQNAFRADD
jgi:hypothetical protein